MPVWRFILPCASSVRNQFNPLSCWCPWRTLVGFGLSQVSFNKLAGYGGDQDPFDVVLENRRGGGLKDKLAGSGSSGKFRSADMWSSYMAAKPGCRDLRPGWRPLHTPVQLLRMCVCNLLRRRPLVLKAAVHAFLRPSGLVPGAEQGRRDLRSSSASGDGEDEGLDCVFANLCKVLLAKIQDHDIFPFSVEVLHVKCNFTAVE